MRIACKHVKHAPADLNSQATGPCAVGLTCPIMPWCAKGMWLGSNRFSIRVSTPKGRSRQNQLPVTLDQPG